MPTSTLHRSILHLTYPNPQAANVPERRAERPWLVIYGHHPMYCSHFTDDEDCLNANNRLRVGIPELNM